ncbi:MAG TPA: geranylgeranyl pyrophosphate synthase [Acidimicrobiaceae bacterium]|jgi:heptaprenyl diphosphate synthase|nr:geranylgeranyl pyrophosphate synthase [Acidimicrobiaceae bacterium]HCV37062.1 geranylgeranyl pyrophosphate synthase [Acidimicrobiaceae bacterium]|tara:strand:- start:8882 stop:9838 length:957 start_codon:yes stop_codon:yes gene_type:complete
MAADLERIEVGLRQAVEADNPFLTEMARHLIDAGGKRIRPALAITASLVTSAKPSNATDDVISGGVAVELVHQGSLYHDDVMDGADTRRTVESVNARWGNLEAILAGDYLLARASEIAARLGTEIAGLLASTIASLCEGQVREMQHAFDVNRTRDAYLTSISGKTAALLATSARVGAIVAGHPRQFVEAVTDFGYHYGMAFQIIDDILDMVATDDQLGKPAGNDLVEGVYTLPVILALGGPSGGELRELLGGPIDDATRDHARRIIRSDTVIDGTTETAVNFTDRARTSLDDLPQTPAVSTLRSTCDLLLARVAELPT